MVKAVQYLPSSIPSLSDQLVPGTAGREDRKKVFLNTVPVSLNTQIILTKEKTMVHFPRQVGSDTVTEHHFYFAPNKNGFYVIMFSALNGKSGA